MNELVFVDTENVGYNIIKSLNMDKVKKLVLVDGSRENNIRLSADILQTLLEYSNKGKIERVYTDKKEKNAADYLLILNIGMIISKDKATSLIKILSGDKIFETIANLLKEMGFNVVIENIHKSEQKNNKSKQKTNKSQEIIEQKTNNSQEKSKPKIIDLEETIDIQTNKKRKKKNKRKRKRDKDSSSSDNSDKATIKLSPDINDDLFEDEEEYHSFEEGNSDSDNEKTSFIPFNEINFFEIKPQLTLDEIYEYLQNIWEDNRNTIRKYLSSKKTSGLKFSIRKAIQKHPQYKNHNSKNDLVYFKK